MLVSNKKIPLTSNKLATMANALLGEQQQNTPQLEVVPMTNCNEEVAQLRELIVKDIVFNNNSATVYQTAAFQAFIGSFGAYMVDTEYTHAKSFDLDIVYRYFKDASKCYWDLGAERVNKTDGMFGGYISRMTRAKFRQVFGKAVEKEIMQESSITQSKEEIALATQPGTFGDDPFSWADDEGITILDHFVRKFEKETLFKMSNGRILDQEEMDELIEHSRIIQEQIQKEQMQQMMQQLMQQGQEQQQPQDMQQLMQPLPQEQQAQPMQPQGNPMEQMQAPQMGMTTPGQPESAEGREMPSPVEEEGQEPIE
jgi:hypothetical protein